ncbi:glycoprotein Xg [Marmota marmota marmota]|uniref:glycoprotein Xg n=1 Tax=Marmota marmota marmota TaxID=9994 RepID=UPI0020922E6F|nr:glycoprotein Xg [Marmota marmota marmota]
MLNDWHVAPPRSPQGLRWCHWLGQFGAAGAGRACEHSSPGSVESGLGRSRVFLARGAQRARGWFGVSTWTQRSLPAQAGDSGVNRAGRGGRRPAATWDGRSRGPQPAMETRRGLPGLVLLLCLLPRAPAQGDFDLADALDDPEPTPKPSSDIYPKPRPPHGPQPANPDSGGNTYPRPKPQPRPQPGSSDNSGGGYHHNDDDGRYPPRPRPPAGGGGSGGYSGGSGGYGHTDGRGGYRPKPRYGNPYGGDGQSTYGNPQGNTVARIVSPIVSVVVVALVGAGVSYFKSNPRRNCFRASDPETV